jgi:hypothetical protein
MLSVLNVKIHISVQPREPGYEEKAARNETGFVSVIDMPMGQQYQITLYWVLR